MIINSHPTPARAYAELNLLKMKLKHMRMKLKLERMKCRNFIEYHETKNINKEK